MNHERVVLRFFGVWDVSKGCWEMLGVFEALGLRIVCFEIVWFCHRQNNLKPTDEASTLSLGNGVPGMCQQDPLITQTRLVKDSPRRCLCHTCPADAPQPLR